MVPWLEFIIASVVVVFCGYKLCIYADKIAEITKLGRSFIGFMLLAVVTSMPELSVTLGAVKIGALDLALGDLFGSNLFNLTIVGVILLIFIKAPKRLVFESTHFATSGFSLLLVALSAVGIIFYSFSSHNVRHYRFFLDVETALILAFYIFGAFLIFKNEKNSASTLPKTKSTENSFLVWVKFLIYSGILISSAVYLAGIGDKIAQIQIAGVALGGTFVGSLLLAITTSLPEMTVAISSVKLGSLDMALGNIFGSNMFNMLTISFADLALGRKAVLSAVSAQHLYTIAFVVISTGLVCAGLASRARRKMPALAWDSVSIIFVYFAANIVNYFLR